MAIKRGPWQKAARRSRSFRATSIIQLQNSRVSRKHSVAINLSRPGVQQIIRPPFLRPVVHARGTRGLQPTNLPRFARVPFSAVHARIISASFSSLQLGARPLDKTTITATTKKKENKNEIGKETTSRESKTMARAKRNIFSRARRAMRFNHFIVATSTLCFPHPRQGTEGFSIMLLNLRMHNYLSTCTWFPADTKWRPMPNESWCQMKAVIRTMPLRKYYSALTLYTIERETKGTHVYEPFINVWKSHQERYLTISWSVIERLIFVWRDAC